MRAVMGIDAAWTSTEPSGVALAVETSDGWSLRAVESSYQRFVCLTDKLMSPEERPSGSQPDARSLLVSARQLCGGTIDLVAIDMPLSKSPIVGRRSSDNAVSKAYGKKNCGTHSPSGLRPGRMSDELRLSFEQEGFSLNTTSVEPPGLIEVYPHPALVELADAPNRLPYKTAKVRSYWPLATPVERHTQLYEQWSKIVALLEHEIKGVTTALPPIPLAASGRQRKAYEDALDAVVCAWVAVCALEGRAKPYGDEDSAIWIPDGRR